MPLEVPQEKATPPAALSDDVVAGPATEPTRVRVYLGKLRRKLREIRERTLHPYRRRAARARLAELGRVERVLFVCHGNIYRSPYAEAVFRAELPPELRESVVVVSAGFVGPGRPVPTESIDVAQRRGLDLAAHRSQLLTPGLVREAHLVVVMSQAQEREIRRHFGCPRRRVLLLGDFDPDPIRTREVTDPWNRSLEVLEESTERVARCAREMLAELVKGLR